MFQALAKIRRIRTFRSFSLALAIGLLMLASAFWLLPVFWEPPRLEQEFKISFSGSLDDAAKRAVYERVAFEIRNRRWKNDTVLAGSYYLGSDLDTLVFEDLYFDTPEGLLDSQNISYRLRYRWKTEEDLRSYRETGISPQRLELQAKAYPLWAVADSSGYKKALKNRYEIKNDYRLNFITAFLLRRQNGEAFVRLLGSTPLGSKFTPVELVRSSLEERGISNFQYQDLAPAVRIITERTRFHINKKTPFGSGDNPDNAILVTLDRSRVYADDRYQIQIGAFSEVEVDFERNTFHRLFDSAYVSWQDSLKTVIASFEEDQSTVKDVVVSVLKECGYKILPPEETETKYRKARGYGP